MCASLRTRRCEQPGNSSRATTEPLFTSRILLLDNYAVSHAEQDPIRETTIEALFFASSDNYSGGFGTGPTPPKEWPDAQGWFDIANP